MIFKLELSPQNFHYDVLYPLYTGYRITQTNALYINQDIYKYLLQTKLSRYFENRAIKMFSEYELNILFYRMQTYTKDVWYEIIQNLSSHFFQLCTQYKLVGTPFQNNNESFKH